MTHFELVATLAASVLAERLAFRWAKYDLVPWVRWLQDHEIPVGHGAQYYLKYLQKNGL